MAGTTVGRLNAILQADTTQFTAQLKSASKEVESFSSIAAGFFGVGLGIGAVTSFLTSAAQEAADAARATGQLEATLEATGYQAGITAGEISKLAKALEDKVAIDDDEIKSAAAVLVSFQNISGAIIKEALPALADFARFKKIPMEEAALKLGKALSDPIEGLAALQKAGVKLSEEQKKEIEYFIAIGDTSDAARVIIERMADSFKDSAEKMTTGTDRLTQAMRNLKEEVGGLPLISGAIEGLTENIKQFGAVVRGGGPYGAYIESQKKAAEAAGEMAEALTKSGQGIANQAKAMPELLDMWAAQEQAHKDLLQLLEQEQKTINNVTERIKEQAATVGMNSDQIDIWRLKQAGAEDETVNWAKAIISATEQTKNFINEMSTITSTGIVDRIDEMNKKWRELDDALAANTISVEAYDTAIGKLIDDIRKGVQTDLKKLFDETRTPVEKAQKEIEDLNDLLNNAELDPDVYRRRLKQIEDQLSGMIEMKDELLSSPGGAALEFGTAGAYSATRAQMLSQHGDQQTHEKLDGIKAVLDRIRSLLAENEPIVVEAGV